MNKYVAAFAITAALIGAACSSNEPGPTVGQVGAAAPEAVASAIPTSVPEPEACIDGVTAATMADSAVGELTSVLQAAKAMDLAGAETGLHAAADYARQAAAASEADPSISVPLEQAADLFDSAGVTIGSATTATDVNAATADIQAATGYIQDATAATQRTDALAC